MSVLVQYGTRVNFSITIHIFTPFSCQFHFARQNRNICLYYCCYIQRLPIAKFEVYKSITQFKFATL